MPLRAPQWTRHLRGRVVCILATLVINPLAGVVFSGRFREDDCTHPANLFRSAYIEADEMEQLPQWPKDLSEAQSVTTEANNNTG